MRDYGQYCPISLGSEVLADRWTPLGRYEGEAKVRAAPFDAIELELGTLWI